MERRKFIAGLGSLTAAGAAGIGTGAFSSVSANRGVGIEVADDSSAFLGLSSISDYASTTSDNSAALTIDLDEAVEGGGSGINSDATTSILKVFRIENQGTEDVAVSIDSEALNNALDTGTGSQLHFYVGTPGGKTLDTYDPNSLLSNGNLDPASDNRILGEGDYIDVGLYVVNNGADWDVDEDVTISAYDSTTLANNDV